MLGVKIISVGKIKEKSMSALIGEYAKRLSPYAKFEIIEIPEANLPKNPGESEIQKALKKEERDIISKIGERSFVAAMCIEGKKLTSPGFAELIERTSLSCPEIDFIIGSSHGLGSGIKKRADLKLSMSDMTFPHNMARLMLTEQIYRAFKIINNETYHK